MMFKVDKNGTDLRGKEERAENKQPSILNKKHNKHWMTLDKKKNSIDSLTFTWDI